MQLVSAVRVEVRVRIRDKVQVRKVGVQVGVRKFTSHCRSQLLGLGLR
jgi:hypothetical protein